MGLGALGGASERLAWILDADPTKAVAGFKQAGDSAEKELGRADAAAKNSGRGLQAFGAGAVVFAAVAAKGLADFAGKAEEAEAVNLRLENSVSNNAATAGDSVKPYEDLAMAIEHKTAASHLDIEAAEQMLIQFGLTKDQVTTLTPLVTDLAQKYGIDFNTAAKLVGKSVEGSSGALKKQGIIVDETKFKTDHYGATVDALRKTVGGFAEQEGATFSGRMERLGNEFSDLEEQVGVGVVKAFEHFADAGEAVIGVFDKLSPGMSSQIGEWATYGVAALGAAGALSFTIGTIQRAGQRLGVLGDWLDKLRGKTNADTVETDANSASKDANATATDANAASKDASATATEASAVATDVDTASKDASTVATEGNTVATEGNAAAYEQLVLGEEAAAGANEQLALTFEATTAATAEETAALAAEAAAAESSAAAGLSAVGAFAALVAAPVAVVAALKTVSDALGLTDNNWTTLQDDMKAAGQGLEQLTSDAAGFNGEKLASTLQDLVNKNHDFATALSHAHVTSIDLTQALITGGSAVDVLADKVNHGKDVTDADRAAFFSLTQTANGMAGSMLTAAVANGQLSQATLDATTQSHKFKDGTINMVAVLNDLATKGLISKDAVKQLTDATGGDTTATDANAEAHKAAEQAITDETNAIRGAIDPLFGMVNAELANTKAQQDAKAASDAVFYAQLVYNDAVKRFGPVSAEAQAAQVDLSKATADLTDKNIGAVTSAENLEVAAVNLSGKIRDGSVSLQDATTQLQSWVAQGLITQTQADDLATRFANAAVQADSIHGNATLDTTQADSALAGLLSRIDNAKSDAAAVGIGFGVRTPVPRAIGGFAGGSTKLDEQGPEVVDLPTGSYVHTSVDRVSLAAAKANSNGGVNFYGPVTFGSDVQETVDRMQWAALTGKLRGAA